MFESMRPHLAELRTRLAISVAAILLMFVVAFLLHNPILTWVTQPLNDALAKVKVVVEKRDNGTWKVHHPDTNRSTASASIPTPSPAAATLPTQAAKLKKDLFQASKLLVERHKDPTDIQLSILLEKAANTAGAMAVSTEKLLEKLSTKPNATAPASKAANSFWGSITTHQVGGAFFVALKVSFFAGLFFALPIILWQLWLFIAPGLYDNEKKMVIPFVVGGSVMFTIGVLFAYYVVTPFGFQFLITFGSFLYTPLINIEDYVGFFTKILLGFGIAFELPIVAAFLGMLGLITDKTLIRFFKYAIVAIFILAALLTPPDVLTQVLMATPLIVLYGISILILRFINPEKPDESHIDKQNRSKEQETLPTQKADRPESNEKNPHETDEPFADDGNIDDEDFDFGDDDFDELNRPESSDTDSQDK
jgi:sec-independent protein translocase protein TatC